MEQSEILYRGVHIRERNVHALDRHCVVWYSSLVHRKCVSSTVRGVTLPNMYFQSSPYLHRKSLKLKRTLQTSNNRYGVPRVWYFPVLDLMECLRSYCTLICRENKSRTRLLSHDNVAEDFEQQQQRDDEESNGSSRDKVVVSVKGLRKEFSNGQVAVKGLNLDLFQDDITVLLGHNGAGKTTTISMLTGLLPPTSGDAIVYDDMGRAMSVSNDLQSVRKSLGICPQHDVLYPDLTVQEHLVLFAIIKGVRGNDEIDRAVTKQIRAIRLEKKRHTASKALSGGQRRRLSVAIAMVGDSQVVLLDEPSSGLDPKSRRVTWDMLREAKKNRAIVLTTHFMDEADALGDRIAIMGHGELICCDTPLALKVRYGVGYTLSFDMGVVSSKGHDEEEKTDVDSRKDLCAVVKKHVSSAVMTSSSAGELSFRLPTNASSSFPPLLEILENEHSRFGIETWGLSMTTLEEVFLSLTKRAHKKLQRSRKKPRRSVFNRLFRRDSQRNEKKKSTGMLKWLRSPAHVEHVRLKDVEEETKKKEEPVQQNQVEAVWNVKSGPRSHSRQFMESLRKRWISAKRDPKGFFCLIVVPICTVALVLVILQLNVAPTGPSLKLYPDTLYGEQSVLVANSESSKSSRDTCRLIDELSSPDLVTTKYNEDDSINSVEFSVSPLLEESRSRSRRRSHWLRMGAYVSVLSLCHNTRIFLNTYCITHSYHHFFFFKKNSTQIEQVRFQRHATFELRRVRRARGGESFSHRSCSRSDFQCFCGKCNRSGCIGIVGGHSERGVGERRQRSDCVCVRCDY